MPPPSPLGIATQSVLRLVKEETYYHKELAGQQARVKKLEEDIQGGNVGGDQNAEYVLRQEVCRYSPCTLSRQHPLVFSPLNPLLFGTSGRYHPTKQKRGK